MPRLRVTQRCLSADLSLSGDWVSREAEHFAVEHPAIRTFVGMRSQAPAVGENVLSVVPYGHVKSLHSGRGRGATIYDDQLDVCWLLAYGDTHAIGEDRDVFKHFEKLSRRGELLPTPGDYEALSSVSHASLIDSLLTISRELHDEAQKAPGSEAGRTIELVDESEARVALALEVVVEQSGSAKQTWISVSVPYEHGFGVEQVFDLIGSLIPEDLDLEEVDFASDVLGRPIQRSEIALTWCEFFEV